MAIDMTQETRIQQLAIQLKAAAALIQHEPDSVTLFRAGTAALVALVDGMTAGFDPVLSQLRGLEPSAQPSKDFGLHSLRESLRVCHYELSRMTHVVGSWPSPEGDHDARMHDL